MSNARNLADAETRFVNASGDTVSGNLIVDGDVGIGTSSPSGKLHVAGGASNVNLYLSNDSYSSYYYQNTGGSSGVTFPASQAYIWDSGGTERMRIDSAGRVTMPYQPGCFVQFVGNSYTGSTGPMNVSSANSLVTFYNDGSHFNPSTAKFTAPVSGKYLVTVLWYYGSGGAGYLGANVVVNGSSYGLYWYNNASNYSDASVQTTKIVKVSALDEIGVGIYAYSSDSTPDLLFNVQYLG